MQAVTPRGQLTVASKVARASLGKQLRAIVVRGLWLARESANRANRSRQVLCRECEPCVQAEQGILCSGASLSQLESRRLMLQIDVMVLRRAIALWFCMLSLTLAAMCRGVVRCRAYVRVKTMARARCTGIVRLIQCKFLANGRLLAMARLSGVALIARACGFESCLCLAT